MDTKNMKVTPILLIGLIILIIAGIAFIMLSNKGSFAAGDILSFECIDSITLNTEIQLSRGEEYAFRIGQKEVFANYSFVVKEVNGEKPYVLDVLTFETSGRCRDNLCNYSVRPETIKEQYLSSKLEHKCSKNSNIYSGGLAAPLIHKMGECEMGLDDNSVPILTDWMLALNENFVLRWKITQGWEYNKEKRNITLNRAIKYIGMETVEGIDCFKVKFDSESICDFDLSSKRPKLCKSTKILWIEGKNRVLLKGEIYVDEHLCDTIKRY